MKKRGIVKEIYDNVAVVGIPRESACGESCGSCNLCKISEVTVKVKNTLGAKAGDIVEMELVENSFLHLAFAAFILPILLPFVSFIAFDRLISKAAGITAAVVSLVVWGALMFFIERNLKKDISADGEITSIVNEQI